MTKHLVWAFHQPMYKILTFQNQKGPMGCLNFTSSPEFKKSLYKKGRCELVWFHRSFSFDITMSSLISSLTISNKILLIKKLYKTLGQPLYLVLQKRIEVEEYLQVSYLEDTKGKPGGSEDGLLIYTYLISVIIKLRLPDLNKAIL